MLPEVFSRQDMPIRGICRDFDIVSQVADPGMFVFFLKTSRDFACGGFFTTPWPPFLRGRDNPLTPFFKGE